MKKLLTVILSAACLLTGCAAKQEAVSGSEPQQTAETPAPEAKKNARVTTDGTKFMVYGKKLWINGVNTPWQSWNDFCGNMDEAVAGRRNLQ